MRGGRSQRLGALALPATLAVLLLGAAPAEERGGRSPLEGITVHLVPDGNPAAEIVLEAASTSPVPPGSYNYWLQGEWLMSPYAGRRVGAGPRGGDVAAVGLPLVPAGLVTVAEPLRRERSLQLHVLRAGSYRDGFLRYELQPRRVLRDLGEGVLMPAGMAVAALWDPRSEAYVALSPPFQVAARSRVVAPLAVPGTRADLVARVRKLRDEDRDAGMTLWLETEHGRVEPELVVETYPWTYGFWYRLEAEESLLCAESRQGSLEEPMALLPGSIERAHGHLAPKAALEVILRLPEELEGEALELELFREGSPAGLERRRVLPRELRQRFSGLFPGAYQVVLHTVLGGYGERVELTPGASEAVALTPEPFALHGAVTRGDEPVAAALRFQTVGGISTPAATDDQGRYQVTLLQPATGVAIEPWEGGHGFRADFEPLASEAGRWDLDLALAGPGGPSVAGEDDERPLLCGMDRRARAGPPR